MNTFSTNHIDYLDRSSFLDESRIADLNRIKWLYPSRDSLNFLQIISIPKSASSEPSRTTEAIKMGDVLTGINGLEQSLIYAIIGEPTQINLLIATCQHQTSNPDLSHSLPALLSSTYPGIKIKESKGQNLLNNLSYTALITGTPTLKLKSNQSLEHQCDRLIRSLYGTRWAYIVIAQPLSSTNLANLSDTILNELRIVTNSERSANSLSINPTAEKYKQLLNRFYNKIQTGKSQGMWQSIGYLLAEDVSTLNRAKAAAKSVFSGSSSIPDPIRVINLQNSHQQIATFGLPDSPPPQAPGQIKYPSQYLSLLNSPELAAMVHLPTQEFPGYFVHPQAQFDVTPHHTSQDGINLGEILNQGNSTGVNYKINPDTLTRHSLIVGTTGSGKTNTIFHLLRQLAIRNLPFLVIEPAKTEYRALLESDELKDKLRIFTLGKETISPFRLNPFQILPGVSVQAHIDHLKSVFNASFVMYAPMPYVLEQCIHEVYEDKGWNLITNENERSLHLPVHNCAHPTLTDLYNKIEEVVDKLGYESKITMDIKAALKTRINSLRIGGKGLMLDTPTSLPIDFLLEAPTILELDHVGDDDEKAFLIGLILMSLYEYYRTTGHTEDTGLKHITVVEEAHRLLKNTPPVADLETANMAGKAVEFFSNLLAEIRAYGEGIVVAEQIPSKLASDIIKNTNLKIVHRIMAAEDRELIGGAMCLKEDQSQWLACCATGEAAIFSEGDDSALRVKVPYSKLQQSFKGSNSDKKVKEAMNCFQEDNRIKWCFNPYPWSNIEASIRQQYHREASRLLDNPEFQEAFARCVISIVILGSVLPDEISNIGQIIAKNSRQGNNDGLQEIVLTYGIDWLLETRARQNHVAYEKLPKLKRIFSKIIFNDVASSNELLTFQTEYKELFTCRTKPFIGCDRVCGSEGCLYRYDVLPFIGNSSLFRRFTEAMEHSKPEELWKRLMSISQMSARRTISTQAPPEQIQKAALCFAIQSSEAMPKLDYYLKDKIATELYKIK